MQQMVAKHGNNRESLTPKVIRTFVMNGAVKRLRPKLMTVSVGLFGLIPILWATGVGSDIMRPITIPLIGGTISSTIYVLLITPVVFEMLKERELKTKGKIELIDVKE
jgi:Cu(I)/Ag(I) efflux system membrane protein CusA/SilA